MYTSAGSAAHRRAQRVHAIARCMERYSVRVTISEYLDMCDRVWSFVHGAGTGAGDVEHCGGRGTNNFWLRRDGVRMLVGWDTDTRQIKTFLPLTSPVEDAD